MNGPLAAPMKMQTSATDFFLGCPFLRSAFPNSDAATMKTDKQRLYSLTRTPLHGWLHFLHDSLKAARFRLYSTPQAL